MEMHLANVPMERMDEFLQWYYSDLDQWTIAFWKNTIREHLSQSGLLGTWIAREIRYQEIRVGGAYLIIHPGRLGVLQGPVVHLLNSRKDGVNGEAGASSEKVRFLDPREFLQSSETMLAFMIEMIRGMMTDALASGAGVVQSVVEVGESRDRVLAQAGMFHVANLQQMECRVLDVVLERRDDGTAPGEWRRFQESELSIWLNLLEKSYESTMDCPKMNGLRMVQDTWDGYVASAQGDLREWWICEQDSEIRGCLLLTRLSDDSMELTYMALLPAYRGMGLGPRMLDFALQRCVEVGVETLVLSVDCENAPALRLYEKRGFREVRKMSAWFWPALSAATTTSSSSVHR